MTRFCLKWMNGQNVEQYLRVFAMRLEDFIISLDLKLQKVNCEIGLSVLIIFLTFTYNYIFIFTSTFVLVISNWGMKHE